MSSSSSSSDSPPQSSFPDSQSSAGISRTSQGKRRSSMEPEMQHPPLQDGATTRLGNSSGEEDAQISEITTAQTVPWLDEVETLLPGAVQGGSEPQPRTNPASDRKRRLTDSAHHATRVRSGSGRYHNRTHSSQPSWSSDVPYVHAARHHLENANRAPDHPRRHSSIPRGAMANSQSLSRARWQPDSDVSQCPICSRPFTFWYRKHHCRKCGRVVCATCSPHRITIAKDLIAHPPDTLPRVWPRGDTDPVVIDLTNEDEGQPNLHPALTPGSQRRNSADTAGEEVRLCNPCVPDPQPGPQTTLDLAEFLRQGQRDELARPAGHLGPPVSTRGTPDRASLYYAQYSQADRLRELRRQRGRGMIFQTEDSGISPVRTRADETPDESLPDYGNFNYTLIPDTRRRDTPPQYHSHPNPPFPPPGYGLGFPSPGSLQTASSLNRTPHTPSSIYRTQPSSSNHARYSSLDALPRPTSSVSGIRPRVRSMLDGDAAFQRLHNLGAASARPGPPQLQESDMCPVCRHELPPRGADGDETAREAHVMQCIAARDPSSVLSTSLSTSTRSPSTSRFIVPRVQMLPFTASEKDCLGEDGAAQECSICFVEYNVNDELARLECLCKFHKACIVQWFSRKPECPVHRID